MPVLALSTLFSQVLGRLTAQAEAGLAEGLPPLPVWANVLRCLDSSGLNERDLAEAARVSKRLVPAAVTRVSDAGWITAQTVAGKDRILRLTDKGKSASDTWRARLAQIDQDWASTPLRESLEHTVGRLPFQLPHFPASYGSADPSAIGGPYMQQGKRKDGIPAHGLDWRPVYRGAGDTVSSLSFTALLSQALLAFTIDYEDEFPWPLASTANVLVHIGKPPTPLPELPANHGITGYRQSLLELPLIVAPTKERGHLPDAADLVL